jgi:hypothetical protein
MVPQRTFFDSAGRPMEVATGITCGGVGAVFGALGVLGVHRIAAQPGDVEAGFLIFVAALIWLGWIFLLYAWRLVFNRARASDAGLLSPTGLRIGGVFFCLAPALALIKGAPLFPLGSLFTAGLASFALARHRARRSARPAEPAV